MYLHMYVEREGEREVCVNICIHVYDMYYIPSDTCLWFDHRLLIPCAVEPQVI